MPDFSAETWSSFRQQFLSVIRFVLYLFDMLFDAVRSNPLLYFAFFFPIFALAFFVIFYLLKNIAPFVPLFGEGDAKGIISEGKGLKGGFQNGTAKKSFNLATLQSGNAHGAASDRKSALNSRVGDSKVNVGKEGHNLAGGKDGNMLASSAKDYGDHGLSVSKGVKFLFGKEIKKVQEKSRVKGREAIKSFFSKSKYEELTQGFSDSVSSSSAFVWHDSSPGKGIDIEYDE